MIGPSLSEGYGQPVHVKKQNNHYIKAHLNKHTAGYIPFTCLSQNVHVYNPLLSLINTEQHRLY